MVKTRQSNMELLRLTAMMLVVLMHIVYNPIPLPTHEDYLNSFSNHFLRMWCCGLTYVNVDVFVLITGWFGTKLSIKNFSNILFQCLFYALISLIIVFCKSQLTIQLIIKMLYPGEAWWFVPPYLGLLLLTPLLNSFIKSKNRIELKRYIILFFCFQMVFGLSFTDSAHFLNGASILSFAWLYLLGRYIRLYPSTLATFSIPKDFFIYISTGLLWALIHFIFTTDNPNIIYINIIDKMHANSNPIVIIGAVYLLLTFSKLPIKNSRLINCLASSAFSIYLIHCNTITFPLFIETMKSMNETYHNLSYILAIIIILLSITACSILIDKIRLFLWDKIVKNI